MLGLSLATPSLHGILTVAALSLLASAPAGSQTGGGAAGTRQARDPMQEGLPLRPTRTLSFTTKVGNWMSVDVSPDGRTHRLRPARRHLHDADHRRQGDAAHARHGVRCAAALLARRQEDRVRERSRRRLQPLDDLARQEGHGADHARATRTRTSRRSGRPTASTSSRRAGRSCGSSTRRRHGHPAHSPAGAQRQAGAGGGGGAPDVERQEGPRSARIRATSSSRSAVAAGSTTRRSATTR